MQQDSIQPCTICHEQHEQMLMLSCIHDPCINCAAIHYVEKQPKNSNLYTCSKCGQHTELDSSSIVQLQRVYHSSNIGKKRYDYRKNVGRHQNVRDKYSQQQELNYPNISHTYTAPITQPYPPPSPVSYNSQSSYQHPQPQQKKLPLNNYVCPEHSEEQMSYFCFSCCRPICPECAIHGQHRQHEVQTTRKSIKQIKINLGELTNNIVTEISDLSMKKQRNKKYLKDMLEENRRDHEELKKYFINLRNLLNQKEKQMVRSIDTNHERNCQNNREKITQIDQIVDNYHNAKKSVDNTLKKDDIAVLQQYSKRQQDTKSLLSSYQGNFNHEYEQDNNKYIDYNYLNEEISQVMNKIKNVQIQMIQKK